MHGYSLSCWQSSLQVLLEKKPGSIQIANLHALGLLEANFNAAMKYWLVTVWSNKPCRLTSSHLNVMVASLATMSSKCPSVTAYWPTSHQCHHPLAIACEDFAQCYDQRAHCPASLACQCLGITPEVMSTIFFSIQFMKFYLCTAYSDLAIFYGGGLSQHPFQGIC